MSLDERHRFMRDMEGVIDEYRLRPEEAAALKTLEPLAVAKAGAHPILAWTAIHLVAADRRSQS